MMNNSNYIDNQIAKELVVMAQYDHWVREELLKEGKFPHGYNPDMEQLHERNAEGLDEMLF